jgi:hypothetical protein
MLFAGKQQDHSANRLQLPAIQNPDAESFD